MLDPTITLIHHETPMFSHRRQLRRWAARLLLVWLFGVVTGVANACAVGFTPGAEALAAAAPAHHHDADEDDHAKGDCADFCQKVSITAPSAQSSTDKVTLAALPLFASIAPASAPQPMASFWPDMPSDRQGAPPISILFLRLAL